MGDYVPRLDLDSRFSADRVLKVSLALLLSFLFLRTSLADHLSNAVATALAMIAGGFLSLLDQSLLRTGVELRQGSTGFALSVTDACDGLGISMVYLAIVAALRRGPVSWIELAKAAFAGFLIIQAVNLIRIVLLYAMLPASSAAFEITHFNVFPLASSALVALLVAVAGNLLPPGAGRSIVLWSAIAIAAAVIWHFIGQTVTGLVLVPLANLAMGLVPGRLANTIALETGQYFVNTNLVTSTTPLRAASLPFAPEAFSLAVPLLAASFVMSGKPLRAKLLLAVAALLSMAVAMSIAAVTVAQGEAAAAGLGQVIVGGRLEPYAPPQAVIRAILAAIQNGFVHFNLFVFPFAVFFIEAPRPPSPAPSRPQRRRRNG